MGLEQQIAAKLAALNTPQQIQGRSGVVWGYDPQNRRWFTEAPGRRRSYANTTMGIPESVGEGANVSADGNVMNAGKGGGLLHGNQEWDDKAGKFVTPFSWDKLGFYATLAALTGGAANAAMSGAPAVAGGTLPATAVPGAATLTTGAIAPGMTPIAGAIAGSAVPGATGALSGLGIGREVLNRITSPQGAAALTALLGMMTNRGPSGGATGANSAQVNDLMNMTVDRAKRTDPLHQSITQLAMSRLPTSVQK